MAGKNVFNDNDSMDINELASLNGDISPELIEQLQSKLVQDAQTLNGGEASPKFNENDDTTLFEETTGDTNIQASVEPTPKSDKQNVEINEVPEKKKDLKLDKNYDPKIIKEKADGIYKIVDGKEELLAQKGQYRLTKDQVIINKEGLYKKLPFLEKQSEAIKDYCATKKVFNKSIKFLPGTIKGLGFVCASIGGYKLGSSLSDKILGKESA